MPNQAIHLRQFAGALIDHQGMASLAAKGDGGKLAPQVTPAILSDEGMRTMELSTLSSFLMCFDEYDDEEGLANGVAFDVPRRRVEPHRL